MVDSLASSSSTLVGAQKSLQFGRRRASKQLRTGFSFSRPRNIFFQATCQSQLNFFVGVKKKTFVFFLTAICGLVKDCFICKTLHFAFCLDFLICTGFLNLLMCGCLACLFLFCSFKIRPEALSLAFSSLCVEKLFDCKAFTCL